MLLMLLQRSVFIGALSLILTACGGGGGGGGGSSEPPPEVDNLAVMTDDNFFVAGASLDLANAPHALAMMALTAINMAGTAENFSFPCPDSQHAVTDGGSVDVNLIKNTSELLSGGDEVSLAFNSCRFPALLDTKISGEMHLKISSVGFSGSTINSLNGELDLSQVDVELACENCEAIEGVIEGVINVAYRALDGDRESIHTDLSDGDAIYVADFYRMENYSSSAEYQLSTGLYSVNVNADIGAPSMFAGVFKLRTEEALTGNIWTEPRAGHLMISAAKGNYIRLNANDDGLVVDLNALGDNGSFHYGWRQFSSGALFGIVGKYGIENILNPIQYVEDTGRPYLLLSQVEGISETQGWLSPKNGFLMPDSTVSLRYNRELPWQGMRKQKTEYNGEVLGLDANLDASDTLLTLSFTGEIIQNSSHFIRSDDLGLVFGFSFPSLVSAFLPEDKFVHSLAKVSIDAMIHNQFGQELTPSWTAKYLSFFYYDYDLPEWLEVSGFNSQLDTSKLYEFSKGNIVYVLLRSSGGYEHIAIAEEGEQSQRQYAKIIERSGVLSSEEQAISSLHIGEVSIFDGGDFFSIKIADGISNERFTLLVQGRSSQNISPYKTASYGHESADDIELSITNGHDDGFEWGGSSGEKCESLTATVEHLDGSAPVDHIERYAADITVACDEKKIKFEVRKFTTVGSTSY